MGSIVKPHCHPQANQLQTSLPRLSTLAVIPPLRVFPSALAPLISARCRVRAAKRCASASALAAFFASRRSAFCRCRFVSVSGARIAAACACACVCEGPGPERSPLITSKRGGTIAYVYARDSSQHPTRRPPHLRPRPRRCTWSHPYGWCEDASVHVRPHAHPRSRPMRTRGLVARRSVGRHA
jgi:hypothetical protein